MQRKYWIGWLVVVILIILGCLFAYSYHIAQQAKGDYEYSSPTQIKNALAEDPMNLYALRGAATESIDHHDYPSAVGYLERAIQASPNDKGSRLRLAHALLLEHKKNEAIPILETLSQDNDQYSRIARDYLQKVRGAYTIH